nr:putative ribonuclease H-like domain-containing protein [Tanacetum cinerariifolium]
VSTPQESNSVNNDKVIAPGMFRINPSKTSMEEKQVPNTIRASARTKPITVSQPHVITKKDVNSDVNVLSSTGVDNTKTRRPQPRSNTKNDRVPSASKSSRSKNKEAEVEEHHRNLLLSKNNKHMSSTCNNIKIDSHNVYSKVVCAMCKQCLISVNHDECLLNYVNDKNSRGKNQKARVSFKETQMKYQPKVTKPKKVGTRESLATPKPRKPRFLLRWSPTGKMFDKTGKIVASSEFESQSDCSNGDNACTSNTMEPKIKRFFQILPLCLIEYFDTVGISHQMSSVRTPQQNGVVERRNRTLVEAARTMLIVSRAPLFLWTEAIATASKPRLNSMTSGHISSGLDLIYAPTITTQQPSEGELDLLFEAMYDDYIGGQPSATARTVLPAQEPQNVKEAMTDPAWIDSMQEELL